MHVHIAVSGYLGKPLRHRAEGNQHRTRDAHLVAFPRLTDIDQDGVTSAQRCMRVFRSRVDLIWHAASIRSSGDQPC